MQILNHFTPEASRLSVTTIAEKSGLSVSAASRLLAALRSTGLLQQVDGRQYEVGPLAYRLGSLYRSRNRLSDLVADTARALVEETGLTAWVSVLSGTEALLISRIPGRKASPFLAHAGGMLPGHASAAGKALMARMTDDEVRALFASSRLERRTDRSITRMKDLLGELARTRRRGWSVTDQELFIGLVSVGAAVAAIDEPTPMAISLSFPSSSRSSAEVAELGEFLANRVREIGLKVGDRTWIDQPDAAPSPRKTRKVDASR